MITLKELLMGRDEKFATEYSNEIQANLERLLLKLNVVRQRFGKPMTVVSGWRPISYNSKIKGAGKKSNHTMGLACDFRDTDGLKDFVLENLELMQELGFYFEDFRWTPGWVHFQLVAPGSGRRIFVPFSNMAMKRPNAWSGKYDPRFDGEPVRLA